MVKAFREINLSLLLCSRCIYDARPHLKHAPKPHLGYIIFFFFLTILNLQLSNVEYTRRIWLSGKLISKRLTFKLFYVAESH